MARKRKTPWQRIRDAGERGVGCRLSPNDIARLCMDSAIITRADLDDDDDGNAQDFDGDLYRHTTKRIKF